MVLHARVTRRTKKNVIIKLNAEAVGFPEIISLIPTTYKHCYIIFHTSDALNSRNLATSLPYFSRCFLKIYYMRDRHWVFYSRKDHLSTVNRSYGAILYCSILILWSIHSCGRL